jgi:HTH-type transcriptional regulator/antitoxin HigA
MTATEAAYKQIVTRELPAPIRSDAQYKSYLAKIERILDETRRTAAQSKFLELLILIVERYEQEKFPIRPLDPRIMLRELMEVHEMSQADLARLIGSSGVASEILSGKRSLSKTQIKKLSQLFKVSPAVFL